MCLTSEVTTGLFTILGALAGAGITYFGAVRIAAKQAKSIAAANLRAAFAPEMAKLELASRNHKQVNITQVLTEAFPRHAAAIEEYRHFVAAHNQAAYQMAWEQYYCEGGSVRFCPDTAEIVTDENKGPITLEPYNERIQRILNFTKA